MCIRSPGTEGGEQPFFSPDGKWIAYFANHQMKKVAVTGGPPTVLAELPGGLAYGGAGFPMVASSCRAGTRSRSFRPGAAR